MGSIKKKNQPRNRKKINQGKERKSTKEKKENQPRERKKINQGIERKINNLHPAFPLLKQILECKRTFFLHLTLNIDFINIGFKTTVNSSFIDCILG